MNNALQFLTVYFLKETEERRRKVGNYNGESSKRKRTSSQSDSDSDSTEEVKG